MNNDLFELQTYIPDIIFETIPNIKRNGNQLQFSCPICGDSKKKTKKRGTYYLRENSYYCWNAGCPANEKGFSGLQFLSVLLNKPQREVKQMLFERARIFDVRTKNVEENQSDPIADLFNEKIKIDDKKIKTISDDQIFEVQRDWVDLPHTLQKYVDSRKIFEAPYIPKGWRLFYNKRSKRLVIPWDNNYYQERALFDNQLEDKYKFPFNVEKPVFGLELVDPDIPYIFLIEGIFDSIWVKNGVAIGSLKMTKHQLKTIKDRFPNHTLILMPDNQFNDKSSNLVCKKKFKDDPNQLIFIWPRELKKFKDINDMIMTNKSYQIIWSDINFMVNNSCKGIKGLLQLN